MNELINKCMNEYMNGRYKEGHERKKPKGMPVGR
jgi:hypothetical protein